MALTKAARQEVSRRVAATSQRANSSKSAAMMGAAAGAFGGGAMFGSVKVLGIVPVNYIAGGLGIALELMSKRTPGAGRAAFGGMLSGMGLGQLGIEGARLTGGDLFGFSAAEDE